MMWNDGHYYFGWPGMLLVMVATWGLVGVAVYYGARWLGRDRASDPLEILDERLARGEIDVEEYTRLWQAITDRRPVARTR
ncbi:MULTISPECIES: SHOCT domain-containing protein [unclassified Nocardioides]|uniref:SHOCT domain-containing protein n=1 Tax=unclassified Nocardioides TaxID=2615069 RepID=UPI00114D7727|nr:MULTISPECIES: SHOCT domain-containing protein [unclassified Nocardioides]TQK71317.1 putative membrane protein [Nocardioides sp. SLBN-35]WGY04509.1 SHOCT domain-containing protein [Nocardioides sp. QY071]